MRLDRLELLETPIEFFERFQGESRLGLLVVDAAAGVGGPAAVAAIRRPPALTRGRALEGRLVEHDIIVADATKTREDLCERRYDEILAVAAIHLD